MIHVNFKKITFFLLSLVMTAGMVLILEPIITTARNATNHGHVRDESYINAADSTMLRRYLAAPDKDVFITNNPDFNRNNADVDGSGEISFADVELLREYLAATDPATVTLGPSEQHSATGRRYPQLADFPAGTRFIALTFDDGPNTSYTVQILNELSRLDASATFYVNPEKFNANTVPIVQRMIEDGHDVDNHGWDHTSFGANLGTGNHVTRESAREDLIRTSQTIFDVTGYWPWSFRAPFFEWGGASNILLGLDLELNLAFVDSGLDTNDWMPSRTPQDLANTILNHSNPNGGIVLMHDCGGSRQRTVDSLALFIPQMQAMGYEFVTVRELFMLKNITPEVFAGSNMWPRVNQWAPARRAQWDTQRSFWPNNSDWWTNDWWSNSTPPWERNINH